MAGDLTIFSAAVTPSTSNGLVVVTGSQFYNTTQSFSSSQSYTGCFWSGENITLGGCSANNAWGSFYNPNMSAETWTSHMATDLPRLASGRQKRISIRLRPLLRFAKAGYR